MILGREDGFLEVGLGHTDEIEIRLGQLVIVGVGPITDVGSMGVIDGERFVSHGEVGLGLDGDG